MFFSTITVHKSQLPNQYSKKHHAEKVKQKYHWRQFGGDNLATQPMRLRSGAHARNV